MITIRKTEIEDIKNIATEFDIIIMSRTEDINTDNTMVLVEDKDMYGIASYISNNDEAFINILFIKEKYRHMHFGDGLIKSILNLIDKEGIKKVYIELPKNYEGFLINIGLKSENNRAYIRSYFNINLDKSSVIYSTILPDFFETACKSNSKN